MPLDSKPQVLGKGGLVPLNTAIGPDGLVKYDLLLSDSSALEHNLETVKTYTGLEAVDQLSQKDLAFYCNAYNFWCLYLATQKLKKSKGRWKGVG